MDGPRPDIRDVVLAAGRSSRFSSGHKALSPPKGPGFLKKVLKTLSLAGLDDPLVVAGHRWDEVSSEARSLGAEAVVNPDPEQGMFSSVKVGLKAAEGAEAFLILPVDAAFVSAPALLKTIAAFLSLGERAPRSTAVAFHRFSGAATGSNSGQILESRTGHPVILGREAALKASAWSGESGLRGFLASLADSSAGRDAILGGMVPREGSFGALAFAPCDFSVICDIDTEEDLAEAASAAPLLPKDPESEADIDSVLALVKMVAPQKKLPHCAVVALRALRLAEGLRERLGREERSLDFGLLSQAAFMGGLLHDIDHGPSRHDLLAAARIGEIGWPDLAAIVGAHTELPPRWAKSAGYAGPVGTRHAEDADLYEGRSREVIEAAVLVHMADKYSKGEKLVSLDERFGAFVAYGGDPEVIGHVRRRWNAARAIERALAERLGREPMEAMEDRSGSGYEDLAERLFGGEAPPKSAEAGEARPF